MSQTIPRVLFDHPNIAGNRDVTIMASMTTTKPITKPTDAPLAALSALGPNRLIILQLLKLSSNFVAFDYSFGKFDITYQGYG